MTVNTTNITAGPFVGNGVADTFSFTFAIEDKTQLYVWETNSVGVQTLLTVDTDYTVDVDNKQVTRVAGALPDDYSWYIRSNRSPVQDTAFSSQGGFYPWVHEAEFDHLTYLVQQLDDRMNRSVRTELGDEAGGLSELPSNADDRSNLYLKFNDDGDIEVADAVQTFDFHQVVPGSSNVTLVARTSKGDGIVLEQEFVIPAATDTEAGVMPVVDTLTSTSAGKALSANQGRILNNKIGLLEPSTDPEAKNKVTSLPDITALSSLNTAALVDGQAFRVVSTKRAGDFVWRSSDQSVNVSADPQQGLWVAPSSDLTGASGAFERFYTGAPYIGWWGAAGDGSGDDTTAAQAAVDATTGELSTGTENEVFNLSRLTGRTKLKLTGNGTFDFSGNASFASDVDDPLFFFRGTAGPAISVTSNVITGDNVINVTDTSTISRGSIVEIATPGQNGGFIDASIAVQNGELLKVEEVIDATSFRTSDSVVDEFGYATADNAQIRVLNTVDDVVIGPDIKIIGKGRPTSGAGDNGIIFFYGNRIKVHCDFKDVDLNAVRFEGCYDYEASRCHVVHAPKGANGTVAYGIVPSGSSTHGRIFNCKLENMRHGITTSHLSSALGLNVLGVCRHLDIHHNTCINTWHAGISTHNDADYVAIHHNRYINCFFATNVRERNVVVSFDEVIDCAQGVYLSAHPKNILIYGVVGRNYAGSLVFTSFDTTRAVTGIKVVNCFGERGSLGISFDSVASPAASDIEFRGNEFKDMSGPGGSSSIISYTGAAADSLRVYDNVLTDITGAVGIFVGSGGDKVFILRNTIDTISSVAFSTQGTYTKSYGKGNFVADASSFWSGAGNLQNGADILVDNTSA